MKSILQLPVLLLALATAAFLSSCASKPAPKPAPTPSTEPASAPATGRAKKADGKSVRPSKNPVDDIDTYSAATINDPLEPLNRVTFEFNHQLYTLVFRPVSKTYEFIVPKPVRTGVHNAFENAKYPVRLVNHSLQGRFDRAGKETQKFFVNTFVGVGGFVKHSDRYPELADLPSADTGQTFAKWGVGQGPYIVLPVLGPNSVRDTVGYAGDYALNPVNWVTLVFGGATWIIAIPSTNSVRSLPVQLGVYDAATKDSLDRYLAARTAWAQNRAEVAKR